jgi:ubiquinone biosynthesis protein
VRHRLDEFVRATHLYRPLRFIYLCSPWTWFQRSVDASRGARLRLALEELGPIFVKFGQALSTRPDLIPADIALELARLQDQVPPFPAAAALAILERAYGRPLEVFASFDSTPLAAASIAQVHAATLKSGEDVVIKILRPGMREAIDLDLEVLGVLADLAERYWAEARRVRPPEVVAEYRKTILDELDLLREAANAAQLKRNFEGSPLLYVPTVYWDYCRSNVMVMERIHGVVINHMERLREHGTDIAKLAENGVEIFFTQVFRHNFFHADMHPGNIFVQIEDPQNPRYAAVDFGIVGTLQPRDQHYLAENFMAFFDRDYARIAQLHIESGWVPATTRVDELESAVRTVCEPIFNKPLKEISFAQVLLRLFETARRFDMQIQPQLILLQKTLFNIEGLGRQLYPELDLWKTARPVLAQWMRERYGPKAAVRALRTQLPELLVALKEAPRLLATAARRADEDSREVRELRALGAQSERREARRETLLVAAVLWFSGLIWLVSATRFAWIGVLQMLCAIFLSLRQSSRTRPPGGGTP